MDAFYPRCSRSKLACLGFVALGCWCAAIRVSVADLHVPSEYASVEEALAAAVDGDRVLLAPGDHLVENELEVRDASVDIIGLGENETSRLVFVLNSDGTPLPEIVFEAEVASQIRLQDLVVSAVCGSGCPRTVKTAFRFGERVGASIERCRFSQLDGITALEFSGEGRAVLRDCRFDSSVQAEGTLRFVRSRGGATEAAAHLVEECVFVRNSYGGLSTGSVVIDLGSGSTLEVVDSRILENSAPGAVLARVGLGSQVTFEGCEVIGNQSLGGNPRDASLLWMGRGSVALFDRSTVVHNLARAAGRPVFGGDDARLVLDHSIVWGNAPLGDTWSVVDVLARWSCVEGLESFRVEGNLFSDPEFCGWDGPPEVWLAAMGAGGDGTEAAPFTDLRDALHIESWRLLPTSPCIAGGEGGAPIGAPHQVCSTGAAGEPIAVSRVRTLRLTAGDHSLPVRLGGGLPLRIEGAGMDATRVFWESGRLTTGSSLADVTLSPSRSGVVLTDVPAISVGRQGTFSMVNVRVLSTEGALLSEGAILALEGCHVHGSSEANATVQIEGGDGHRISSTVFEGGRGSGLACRAGEVEVVDCRFESHRDSAILVAGEADRVRVSRSELVENVAVRGAALRVCASEAQIDLTDCRLSRNAARDSGGAIWMSPSEPRAGPATTQLRLTRCVLDRNEAAIDACAIGLTGGRLELAFSTLAHHRRGQVSVRELLLMSGSSAAIESSVLRNDALPVWSEETGARVSVARSCLALLETPRGPGNLTTNPGWLPFGGRVEVWVDAAAGVPGDGSRELPFRSLEAAYVDEFALGLESPLLGMGRDGNDIGAPASTLFVARPSTSILRLAIDQDGAATLSDGIYLARWLFQAGATPSCLASADIDSNGRADLTDLLYLLDWLYLQRPAPRPPFEECGGDPDADLSSCRSFEGC